ncbi:KAP family NTPase [Pseudomonas sp. RC10]|uniref:KAP family NTPase n=1 Tax=Pseudomonas bambusae TaxID=3139142 RepID=UPI00313984EE
MDSNDLIARQDRAIDKPEFDALERGPFVGSLVNTLVSVERDTSGTIKSCKSTGLVVGLTGEWGLGKSSVLNLLAYELEKNEHVVVATFNPWLFKGRDELVDAFFNCLRGALGKSPSESLRSVQKQLERYKTSIEYAGATLAAVADALGAGGAATAAWKKWLLKLTTTLIKPQTLSADQERKSLESKLAKAHVAVVVLIDELDRVEDEEVRAVAQLIKAVGDIKGISYLVAYDPDRVAQALGKGNSTREKQISGESYLEKIIQYPIPLRPLLEEDVTSLLKQALHRHDMVIPPAALPYQTEILNHLIRAIRTPRDVKRVIGALSVLQDAVADEICPYDVLAYCWIVTKSPSMRRKISDHTHALVSDPSTQELIRRQQWKTGNDSAAETLTDLFGDGINAHLDMLRAIFPRFDERSQRSAETFDGDRLAKRRNLTRLLYLGNPPGQLSRMDIERIWSLSSEDLINELQSLQQAGRLETLLDCLNDLAPVMTQTGDETFWVGLSRVLTRDHDWITENEVERGFVDDAAAILWRVAHTTGNGTARLKITIDALIRDGDLLITPWILRKHLFAHGFVPYGPQGKGGEIFSADETISLRDRELPRYRTAVLEGKALRRLPDTELIFCILNSDRWDSELRQCLTSQLSSIEAISTFAALITPPGILCDYQTLDLMIDAGKLLERLLSMFSKSERPEDDWIAQAINRLNAVLSRKDPHFAAEVFKNDDAQ